MLQRGVGGGNRPGMGPGMQHHGGMGPGGMPPHGMGHGHGHGHCQGMGQQGGNAPVNLNLENCPKIGHYDEHGQLIIGGKPVIRKQYHNF